MLIIPFVVTSIISKGSFLELVLFPLFLLLLASLCFYLWFVPKIKINKKGFVVRLYDFALWDEIKDVSLLKVKLSFSFGFFRRYILVNLKKTTSKKDSTILIDPYFISIRPKKVEKIFEILQKYHQKYG